MLVGQFDSERHRPPPVQDATGDIATPAPQHDGTSRVDPPPATPPPKTEPLAAFGSRTVGFLIDCVMPVIVLNLLLSIAVISGGAGWRRPTAVVGCLVLLGFGVWNSGYLQGTTGRSLGRRVANTLLVGLETGQPVGILRAVVRQICHVLEFGIGFLWPLWDGKRQTFADKIVRTVVVQAGGPIEDLRGT